MILFIPILIVFVITPMLIARYAYRHCFDTVEVLFIWFIATMMSLFIYINCMGFVQYIAIGNMPVEKVVTLPQQKLIYDGKEFNVLFTFTGDKKVTTFVSEITANKVDESQEFYHVYYASGFCCGFFVPAHDNISSCNPLQ